MLYTGELICTVLHRLMVVGGGVNLVMITIRCEVKGTKPLPITHSFGRSTASTGQISGSIARALADSISDIDTRGQGNQ